MISLCTPVYWSIRLQEWVHSLLPPLCDRRWNYPGEGKYIAYISKDLSDTEGLHFKWYRETRFEEMRIKTMLVRVAAEGRRDMAERIIEYSENGRINTKTHSCHVAADTSVSTCL